MATKPTSRIVFSGEAEDEHSHTHTHTHMVSCSKHMQGGGIASKTQVSSPSPG